MSALDEASAPAPMASVVIIVKNEPTIANTLRILQSQCEQSGAECLVVDASEGRLDEIAKQFPWTRWVHFKQPEGRSITLAHQRNVGVREASGPVIVFCDAGCEPEDGWLASMLARVRDEPNAIFCGPVLSAHDSSIPTMENLPDAARVPFACTANMAFQRRIAEEIGGFDERLDYGEDIDFGWRAERGLGVPVLAFSRARVWADWGDLRRQLRRAYRYGKATPRLLVMHPERTGFYLRRCPDIVCYPAWCVGFVVSLALAGVWFWLPLAWLGLLAAPSAKNAEQFGRGKFLLLKLTRALGLLVAAPGTLLRHRKFTVDRALRRAPAKL